MSKLAIYMYGKQPDQLNLQEKMILVAIYGYFTIIFFMVLPALFFRYMERWELIGKVLITGFKLKTRFWKAKNNLNERLFLFCDYKSYYCRLWWLYTKFLAG